MPIEDEFVEVGGLLGGQAMETQVIEDEQVGGPLTVIWDNSPAHRGDVLRAYLATPGLRLRLVNPVSSTGQALPGYSPDFNADERSGTGCARR